jgi:small GTP-binding protein
MVGAMNVGKTSLTCHFVNNAFPLDTSSTIGVDFRTKVAVLKNGTEFRLRIWDTAGQERFNAITPAYLRGADVIIAMYDLTNKTSWNHLTGFWETELQQHPDAVRIVLGNKLDLVYNTIDDELQAQVKHGGIPNHEDVKEKDEQRNSGRVVDKTEKPRQYRCVKESEARAWAEERDYMYLDTSALDVEAVFCVLKRAVDTVIEKGMQTGKLTLVHLESENGSVKERVTFNTYDVHNPPVHPKKGCCNN